MNKISRRNFLQAAAVAGSALALTACGESNSTSGSNSNSNTNTVKAGFIMLHDENSTYDLNFINGAKEACKELGIEPVILTNVPETSACYDKACELADAKCNFIFADSFSHESFMIEAAKEFPKVQFAHATGTRAHTEGLSNFHNAFASIYEGRYLAGIVAGMKLKEMMAADSTIVPKMGYVGAYTYAEVISGYTSFFLGAKSIVPEVTMQVSFTGSWYDEAKEKEAAQKLINNGCVLLSQHADSMGAPTACETAKPAVPNVSYNGSTESACPNTFLVSSRIDWAPYFKYAIGAMMKGESFATDWCGTIETGSVVLSELGQVAPAAGTKEAVEAAKAKLADGSLHVFDTATFTVGGKALTSYMADVDSDANYTPDHEAIKDGYFNESGEGMRSAPFFDVQIDGIELLDTAF